MHSLAPFLCLVGITLGFVAMGILALHNAEPDPLDCPKDCPVCRGEYDTHPQGDRK